MKTLKRIAHSNDLNIKCSSPFPDNIIAERDKDYHELSDVEFKKKYRTYLYAPAYIELKDKTYRLQYNFCNNTFCKWYGQPQVKYTNEKSKPSRPYVLG